MTHLVAKFGGADCEVGAMTTSQPPDFHLNRPGVLIAALPAVLGFVPEKSLVLVTVDRGEMGCVMRVDLSDDLVRFAGTRRRRGRRGQAGFCDRGDRSTRRARTAECATTNTANSPTVWRPRWPTEGIELLAAHVVDRVAAGGRWHCADGCGNAGTVEDPSASPLAVAAVLDGRRLYARRAELQEVIEVADPARTAALAEVIGGCQAARRSGRMTAARADIERGHGRGGAGRPTPPDSATTNWPGWRGR